MANELLDKPVEFEVNGNDVKLTGVALLVSAWIEIRIRKSTKRATCRRTPRECVD